MSALLGYSKAGELAANVILPFAFSWGDLTDEAKLAENAMDLYVNHPGLAENHITRHMAKQLCLGGPFHFTACHQQGLIHIFKNYCREGRCGDCPLVGSASQPDSDKTLETSYHEREGSVRLEKKGYAHSLIGHSGQREAASRLPPLHIRRPGRDHFSSRCWNSPRESPNLETLSFPICRRR